MSFSLRAAAHEDQDQLPFSSGSDRRSRAPTCVQKQLQCAQSSWHCLVQANSPGVSDVNQSVMLAKQANDEGGAPVTQDVMHSTSLVTTVVAKVPK